MPTLIVEKGPDRGKSLELVRGCNMVFGRDASCDFVMTDPSCSRRHFRIYEDGGDFHLEDMGSTHGTLLNEWKVVDSKLHDGDAIAAGESVFSFTAESTQARGLVGKVVGGYQIIDRLGRGGMGTVYKAKQIALDREVALKVLAAKYSDNKTFINRFFKEAQAAARLNHPNIVQVYDVRDEQGLYLISLELMSKGTVQDLATEHGQLAIPRVLDIARDAAKGLMYAEQKGLVHGDIKPDNLMINADGHIKISDLGLARPAGESMSEGDEGIFGTPHFISPEQALGKPVDARSDIYSLGATLYRLISGRTPFIGASVREIVTKQINDNPDDLRTLRPDCPQDLADFVAVCMAKDPTERFANSSDLNEAIIALGSTGELQKVARRGMRAAIAIVLVLAIGGLFTFLLLRSQEDDNGKTDPPTSQPTTRPAETQPMTEEMARFERDRKELEVAQLVIEAKFFLDSLANEGRRDDVDALKEAKAKFVAAHDRHPDTDNAKKALEEVTALESRISAIENERAEAARLEAERKASIENDYRAMSEKVAAAMKELAFVEALVEVAAAQERFSSTHRKGDVEALLVKVRDDSAAEAAAARKRSDEYVERNEFDAARRELESVTIKFNPAAREGQQVEAVTSLVAAAKSRIDEIGRLEIEKTESDRRLDQGLLFSLLNRYFKGMRDGVVTDRFKREFDTAVATLATEQARKKLATVRSSVERIIALQLRFGARISGDSSLDVRLVGARGVPSGRVTVADEAGLTIEKSAGSVQTVAWGDVDPKSVYRSLFRRIVETPRDRLDLVIFCLDSGLLEEAQREMDDLKKSDLGGLDADVAVVASDLQREVEATRHVDQIKALNTQPSKNSQIWFDIKSNIEALIAKYTETRTFVLYSDGSTPLIAY